MMLLSAPTGPLTFVVDDSISWASGLADALSKANYRVRTFTDALAAAQEIRSNPPEILVTDYFMTHLDGGKLCHLAKSVAKDTGILTVIVTAGADRNLNRPPSPHADAVVAKNALPTLVTDLLLVLESLRGTKDDSLRDRVVGHERLHPRALTSKLHGLKNYLDALQEGIGDAVFGVDGQLRVYTLNDRASKLAGLSDQAIIAKPINEVLALDAQHPILKTIERAMRDRTAPIGPFTTTIANVTVRATVAFLESPDGQDAALLIARDITDLMAAEAERHALHQRLHQSDKMSALGQLTAGICHEINNPLAALIPNITYIAERLPTVTDQDKTTNISLEEVQEVLADTLEAANRIAGITRQMREYSHPHERGGEHLRVEDLVDTSLALAANELRFKATIRRDYGETPKITVDRSRLSQTFLNIILNAAQSFPTGSTDNNWILISSRAVDNGLTIRFENNGPMIPPESVSKLFEPFYTTKPVGQGTGLGLSICYDAVRRHGGMIDVQSTPDSTCFSVWFPKDTGMLPSRRRGTASIQQSTAQILVVDDEPLLIRSFRRQLQPYYTVQTATDGRHALELLTTEQGFDLVVCDLLMPEMNGMDLFREIGRVRPELCERFVFLTGGSFTADARNFLKEIDNLRAYKPLDSGELPGLVAEALEQLSAVETA